MKLIVIFVSVIVLVTGGNAVPAAAHADAPGHASMHVGPGTPHLATLSGSAITWRDNRGWISMAHLQSDSRRPKVRSRAKRKKANPPVVRHEIRPPLIEHRDPCRTQTLLGHGQSLFGQNQSLFPGQC